MTTNSVHLNGIEVGNIGPDLVERQVDGSGFLIEKTRRLDENIGYANQGIIPRSEVKSSVKKAKKLPDGSFILKADQATSAFESTGNPNARPNSNVVRRYLVGEDIIDRDEVRFIIDFTGLSEAEAAMYESPFEMLKPVRQHRALMNQPEALAKWWLPWNNRDRLRKLLVSLPAYIATPRNSKHRVFVLIDSRILPDCEIVAVPKHDFTTLGILQSRSHEVWALRTCSYFGVGNTPRYSHTATFETFPFPSGLTPKIPAADYANDPRAIAIATAAKRLNDLRENWLNPADFVQRVPEVVPGYPDRILPVDDAAAAILKKRTLTNLYNERPTWLDYAHRDLDKAVAAAYGWTDWGDALPDDVILQRLFKLNQERA